MNQRLRTLVERIWPAALLVALLWIVRYWHSSEFGLYEDDLTHLPTAVTMSGQELLRFIFDPVRNLRLYGNGHPIHFTLLFLYANLGWRLAELNSLYWVGFVIGASNVVLFYALLKRIHSQALGIFGGLAYVLYSADTTQAFLTHALGLQPSITLFLLATHAYLSNRRWLAYILATLTLFIYETPYTVFFTVPLLAPKPPRGWARELLRHALILGLILVGVILWRVAVGDDRIAELGLVQAVTIPILHMLQGPVVSLGTYLYRPLQAVQSSNAEILVVFLISFLLSGILFVRIRLNAPGSLRDDLSLIADHVRRGDRILILAKRIWLALPGATQSLLRLAGAGLLMLVLAYPLTFTVRAYAISGRDTRVHAGGVVGAALLVGSLLLLLLQIAETYGWRRQLAVLFAAWIGLMSGYGFVIQRDYIMAWEYQKEFWSELVSHLGDVAEGTVILVDPEGLNDTRQIGANYWNLPRILEQLYEFPDDWSPPPRVIRLTSDWNKWILTDEGMLDLNSATTFAPSSVYGVVDPADAIFVNTTGSQILRSSGEELRRDGSFGDQETGSIGEPPFMSGFLYPYLIPGERR